MARTRSQSQAAASEKGATSKSKVVKEEKSKPQRPEKKLAKSRKPKKSATGKRAHEEVQESHEDEAKREPTKKRKSSEATSDGRAHISNPKVESILSKYGVLPLHNSKLPAPDQPLPETMLALVFNAMLTSARISHEIAARSVSCLIDAGYHDIQKLKNSSWQERTEALTEGGYTHYREKTATMLGDLADLVLNKYGKWDVIIPWLKRIRTLLHYPQVAISTTFSSKQIPPQARSVPH